MSTRIRLRRMGKKKQPFYRIVIADSRSARDSQAIEEIGTYNPITRPGRVTIKENRVYDWLDKGAVPSDTVASLFRRIGLMHKWTLQKAGQDTSQLELKTELVETTKPKGKSKAAQKSAEVKAEPEAPAEAAGDAAAEAEAAPEAEAAAEPEPEEAAEETKEG